MQTALHSPFLQALGYAIANSLWQSAAVWLVFVLSVIIIKPNPANKFRLAIAAQLNSFLWFVFTFQFYFIQCSEAIASNTALQQASTLSFIFPNADNSFGSYLITALIKAEQLLPFLSFAYLLLLFILLLRWFISYNRTQFLRSNGLMPIDENWKQFVDEITSHLKIYNKPAIFISELISSPLTIGFVKPVILVPLASINHLTVPQLEAVLLHELAHIKRYDYILNIFISIIETILFFNPFTQLISKSIKQERENSCDDWVLQFNYNPSMYAEALLQIAYLSKQENLNSHVPLSMNATSQNGELLPRVKRMIGIQDAQFKYRHQLLSLLIITLLFSSIAWFHPLTNVQSKSAKEFVKTKSIIVEPMSAKIENPFFNPVFFLKKPLQKEVEKSIKLAAKNSIQISDESIHKTYEDLATIAPAAINSIRILDPEEKDIDIENAISTLNQDVIPHVSQLKIDTAVFKKNMEFMGNENFLFDFDKINAEISQSKKEIAKAFKNSKLQAAELRKSKDEMAKAMAEINKMKIPFLNNWLNQNFKKEWSELLEKADSIKINNTHLKTAAAEKMIDEWTMRNENVHTPSLYINNALFREKINRNVAKNKMMPSVKMSSHQKNKHIEITIGDDNEEEPVTIIIDIDNN
jgi:beta-lactamase regulating signal transducer with metallopeptidase domain